MEVTEVLELTKARCRISLDNKVAFVLYKGDLRTHHIKLGAEITEETYETIIRDILMKRAKLRALNLIKSRDYTSRQIRKKLEDGFYPDAVIENALSYIIEHHFIDDGRYCELFIRNHFETMSRNGMIQKLVQKGIGKEQAIECYDTIRAEYDEQEEEKEDPEENQIKRFLEKKHFDVNSNDLKEKNRVLQALIRRGYSYEKVMNIMHLQE